MKMLKKVAAIALAGVLALSVLTGCGSKNSTGTVVDGLNDLAKLNGDSVTFVADSQMDEKAAAIAKIVTEKVGNEDFSGKTQDQILDALPQNRELMKALAPLMKFDTAVPGDETKPLYSFSLVEMGQSFNIADGKNAYYAMSMMQNRMTWNYPNNHEEGYHYEEKGTCKVGTATCTIGGKQYMVAMFQCPMVKVAIKNN